MKNVQSSDPEQRLDRARAGLPLLLTQAAEGLVAPQLRANVVQFQAVIAAGKAVLRGARARWRMRWRAS